MGIRNVRINATYHPASDAFWAEVDRQYELGIVPTEYTDIVHGVLRATGAVVVDHQTAEQVALWLRMIPGHATVRRGYDGPYDMEPYEDEILNRPLGEDEA